MSLRSFAVVCFFSMIVVNCSDAPASTPGEGGGVPSDEAKAASTACSDGFIAQVNIVKSILALNPSRAADRDNAGKECSKLTKFQLIGCQMKCSSLGSSKPADCAESDGKLYLVKSTLTECKAYMKHKVSSAE